VPRPEGRVERAEYALEPAEADQLAQVGGHRDSDPRAAEAQARERLDLPQVGHLLVRPSDGRKLIAPTAATIARMAA
jgi:hypothetical protein